MPEFLSAAIDIAREAGQLLEDFARQKISYELKGDYDLVTQADHASERLVIERLQAAFPDHAIVAEETGGVSLESDYRWYVDPLDGTTNFAHGYPMYNVTLALERCGELIAGVIFDPHNQELFAAERGGGAFLNGQRIYVSKVDKIQASLFSTGFPSHRRHKSINIHFYYQLAMASHGVRRGGSAGLDLAYVACGRLDGFWEFGLKPWDMAAGILLVQEAGGVCSDMRGGAASVHGPHILADNGHIHHEVLELFAEIFAGRFRFPLPEIRSPGA